MADFVAVLKKTIDGLGDASAETREKVYAKARGTIAARLAAINPPPPSAVVERQKKALEDAILSVEAEYARPAPQPSAEDDLESIFASLDPIHPKEAVQADGVTPAATADKPKFSPADSPKAAQNGGRTDFGAQPAPGRAPVLGPEATFSAEGDADDEPIHAGTAAPRRRGAGLVIALAVLLIAGGAGYAVWLNRTEFQAMLGLASTETAESATPPETTIVISGEEEGTDQGEDETAAEDPAVDPAAEAPPAESETDIAAVEPAPATQTQPPAAADPAAPAGPQKFTQRLTPDGQEVDVGPAGGTASVGEGTSVATAVIPAEPPAAAPVPDAPGAPAAETPPADAQAQAAPPAADAAQPSEPAAIAVGQRAIFYEERTSAAQGSAETGSIVWSLVQESPGGDIPAEPAIRAEATIPGKDLQLRMTIRRNRDQTLPASHIVEMIFLTPDGFEGGGIENVLRMTMKSSEESPGNPLLGIPAKIADGFFLVALTDGEAEIAQNTTLLSRDQWIDIPMIYRSGRRALITMEKGVPGGRVFDEAIKAWQSASSG